MKKNFIYLYLIVIIVLIACSGKEDDKKETIDKEKRIDLYKKAQDIIQEDLPHYAILYPMQNFAYKKNIKGIEVNKRGFQNTIVE